MSEVAVPLFDLRAQIEPLRADINRALAELIDSASFVGGHAVSAFEQAWSAYVGVDHAIGVGNGTDALTVALRALGIGSGAEVITAANTFVGTAEAIALVGATPVLVDVHEETFNMSAESVRAAVTERTASIIPVHLYGGPAPLDDILVVANEYGLPVIEDAAQAHGATVNGHRAASLGAFGCFSFYPTKNLGAFGDGGAIVTDDEEFAHAARMFRDHGSVASGDQHDVVGQNSRLDAFQAAVLHLKLSHLDAWNARRREHAAQYRMCLADVPFIECPVEFELGHVYHQFVARVPAEVRDEFRASLLASGVATGVHYPEPLHLTRAFDYLRLDRGSFPVSERLASEIVSLPICPELTSSQIAHACDVIRAFTPSRS